MVKPRTYFLTTRRLGFGIWQESDLDLAFRLWSDPEVTRLIGGPFSKEDVRKRLILELQTQREHQVQYWPLFLLATGDHIGCCGLRPYRVEDGIFEAGAHLKTAYQGQGYALEAAGAVIDYAFAKLNIRALFAGHNPANKASRRLIEKLGFRFTHTEFYPPMGLEHPSYLLRSEDYNAYR